MEQSKWELKSHSWQIADTGDYDGYWEITDGNTSICTKDDPDDERLEDVVKVLNSVQCNFYTKDDTELNQRLEIYQLKDEITSLQAKCDRYEKALKDIVKNGENVRATYKTKNKPFYITIANEALNGEGEKEVKDA